MEIRTKKQTVSGEVMCNNQFCSEIYTDLSSFVKYGATAKERAALITVPTCRSRTHGVPLR